VCYVFLDPSSPNPFSHASGEKGSKRYLKPLALSFQGLRTGKRVEVRVE
jgi:hypothetical protein